MSETSPAPVEATESQPIPEAPEASENVTEGSEGSQDGISSSVTDDGYEPITKWERQRYASDPDWRPKHWKPETKVEKKDEKSAADQVLEDLKAEQPKEEPEEASEAPKKEEKKAKKPAEGLHEVTVNGKKLEVTTDDLIRGYQKAAAAGEKFEEAAKVKKQLTDLVELMRTDPIEVLKHPALGHNVRELVENWLYEQIQYENLPEKERELIDVKNELRITRQKEEQAKKEAQAREVEAYRTHYAKQYQQELQEAIDSSGLPKTPETVQRLVYYLKQALARGAKLKAKDVVELVREDYTKSVKSMFGQADAETLVKMFGEDFVKKVQKYEAGKLKDTGRKPEKQPPSSSETKIRKGLTRDEWRERIRKRAGL